MSHLTDTTYLVGMGAMAQVADQDAVGIVESAAAGDEIAFGRIVAELPRTVRDSNDTYLFSPDERQIARLGRETYYDEDTDTETAAGGLTVLKMETLLDPEAWDATAWSVALDHGSYELAGWNDQNELILIDPRTAHLEFRQSADDASRRVPIRGLKPEDFATGAPVAFHDTTNHRLYVGLRSAIAVIDVDASRPSAALIPVEGATKRFHRLGDQRVGLALDEVFLGADVGVVHQVVGDRRVGLDQFAFDRLGQPPQLGQVVAEDRDGDGRRRARQHV